MRVIDRKRIAKLMLIQGVSHRDLADAVGWKGHSYVTRLLSGEIKTVTPERAARLAHFFEVGVDDLFVVRSSSDGGQAVNRKRAS